MPHSREIVHVIPRSYTLDGQEGVRDPVGMMGFRLEVEAHVVTGAVPSIRNLVQSVEISGVIVNELVLQPLASSFSSIRATAASSAASRAASSSIANAWRTFT